MPLSPRVKILVCYHKVSPIIANEILQPILVGATQADQTIRESLEFACAKQGIKLARDDDISGGGAYSYSLKKEISLLNPYFCELTAMYWAWKNLDADYYGLFHYRRVFDFTSNTFFAKLKSAFTPQSRTIAKYHLDSASITSYLQDSSIDIIIPKALSLRPDINAYENFACGGHNIKDLDKAIAYIKETYPFMTDSITQTLFTNGAKICYWNMAIWRKEVFFAYCEWIFDVLFALQEQIDYTSYNAHEARVFGFLGEWLFNVWLHYQLKMRKLNVREVKSKLLYSRQSKFFGKVSSNDCERYYFLFLRIYKKPISPPPPHLHSKA
ncbi:DUF4422 domain-containing protein [Helicobacter japonicus]|uniref:DUF4422 domain-containing protein n=4 Tax=Helicobacter japonicus TaxID=425400 RepID=UPI00235722D3|nr:DUF4422 domain-containing protein [Helicobacter japonicus]